MLRIQDSYDSMREMNTIHSPQAARFEKMTKYAALVICVGLGIWLPVDNDAVSSESTKFDLSDDIKPFPETLPSIKVRESFSSPRSGLAITRITDARDDDPPGVKGGVTNEYATVDPENADGTLLLLMATNCRWYLYDAQTLKHKRSVRMPCQAEPRWHGRDPNLLFYVSDTRFWQYSVREDRSEMLYDFRKVNPDITAARTRSKGDGSADSRYWAFILQGERNAQLDWVTFDVERKAVIASYRTVHQREPEFANWITMSMSGKYVMAGVHQRVVYDRDWSNPRVFPHRMGHGDLAMDNSGREVYVAQDNQRDVIAMVYLDTLEEVSLMKLPYRCEGQPYGWQGGGLHISGNNLARPGWVLVSTYGGASKPCFWFERSLFMLELKPNGRHWHLTHTHSKTCAGSKDYWSEAFATINKAGTRVYWGSNWEETCKNFSDVYRLALPPAWHADLARDR
jgi:hypothetical protein